MDLDFFMAWGGNQTLNDSIGRYPGLCFTLQQSPGAEDLLLAELMNTNTYDAVTVGTRTDLPDLFASSGIIDLALLAALVDGQVQSLLVTQDLVDGERIWTTTSTPAIEPLPANGE